MPAAAPCEGMILMTFGVTPTNSKSALCMLACPPTSTVTGTWLPENTLAGGWIVHASEVSDIHTGAAHAVAPTRTDHVSSGAPNKLPRIVTTVAPTSPPAVGTTVSTTGGRYVKNTVVSGSEDVGLLAPMPS